MSIVSRIRNLLGVPKAVVLMYHRIASPAADPWQLSVSRGNFEEHLRILKDEFDVKSVANLVDELRTSNLKSNSVCITFDDGYEDNLLFAIPLLEKYDLPATFFIPSGWIGGKPFWWDVLGEIFLEKKLLPESLNIEINGKKISHRVTNGLEERSEVFIDVWANLRDQPLPVIDKSLHEILQWAGASTQNTLGNYSVTEDGLNKLAASKMATIGVHTVTHPALATLSKNEQERELNECKLYLDQHFKTFHELVAYPYGNYNEHTLDIIRNGNYRAAFTTDARAITAESDVAKLGRFQVVDQTGNELRTNIKNWLSK